MGEGIRHVLHRGFVKRHRFFLAVFVATAYLSLQGLGHNRYWIDEASTAYFAKNFVNHGRLLGIEGAWDGRNLLTHRASRFYDERIQAKDFQLDKIAAAASFALLGVGTAAGRLPFVLFGLGALGLFWLILHEDFRSFPLVRRYALALVAFSYSFLLSIRQCQYYALSLFFSLALYYAYRKVLSTKRPLWFLLASLAAVLLFFSNYFLCLCFLVALVTVHLLFHRGEFGRREWLLCSAAAALFLLPAAVYAVVDRVWIHTEVPGGAKSLADRLTLLYWNLRDLDRIGYLPGLLVAALVFMALRYRRKEFFPFLFYHHVVLVGAFVVVLSLLSPQPAEWKGVVGGLADVRYLNVILPFTAAMLAVLMGIIHRALGGLVATGVCAVVLCSTILSLNIAGPPFRWLLPAYAVEIHRDYVTPYDAVVEYLEENAGPRDTVYAMTDYNAVPLLFYLGERYTIGGRLRKHEHLMLEKLRELDAPVFKEEYYPTLLVCFGRTEEIARDVEYLSRDKYEYVLKERLDVYWKDVTRPELPWHRFGPVRRFDLNTSAIYVLKRREKKPVGWNTGEAVEGASRTDGS